MSTSTDPTVLLQADGLCFAYPQRPLFSAWASRLVPGVTLVRGGDGCGKSTLLSLLAGALPVQGGTLQVNGVSLAAQPEVYRAQVFWADPRSTAWEQVTPMAYFQSLTRQYPRFDAQAVRELADDLGLTPHLEKPLYMLSTGSKRKVWLAAAFASGAAVTLLDEPFAALDPASIRFVRELLTEAAGHPSRAWMLADYSAPAGVALAGVIDLGD